MGITLFLAAANTTLGMLRILLLILPIIDKAAPINLSNLMLVDGSGVHNRVGRKAGDDGKLKRYSKKSGEILD